MDLPLEARDVQSGFGVATHERAQPIAIDLEQLHRVPSLGEVGAAMLHGQGGGGFVWALWGTVEAAQCCVDLVVDGTAGVDWVCGGSQRRRGFCRTREGGGRRGFGRTREGAAVPDSRSHGRRWESPG